RNFLGTVAFAWPHISVYVLRLTGCNRCARLIRRDLAVRCHVVVVHQDPARLAVVVRGSIIALVASFVLFVFVSRLVKVDSSMRVVGRKLAELLIFCHSSHCFCRCLLTSRV
ncbi:MAG: hypothetical protein ACKPKO_15150, partial [Candidatus Fonsibacter sp.]